jgi:glycerol kinase
MNYKILTIDQGTTSSRSITYDINGDTIESSQYEYPLIYPEDGWVEIDPQILLESVTKSLNDIDKSNIELISITNQRETTVIWEKKSGNPIYNAIVWQDRRTSQYCENIRTENLEKKIQNKTGLILDPYFSATKIKWILDNVSGAKEKALNGELCFGTIDTYLMYCLSEGKIFKTDISNASRTMLFNINTLSWDSELLEIFDIDESLLPEVVMSDSSFGHIELINNAEIHGVLGDQQAALFGQGCFKEGDSKSTYGTGCFVMANIGNKPVLSNEKLLTTVGFSFDGDIHYAMEGSIYSAGTVVQYLRDNLNFFNKSPESEKFLKTNGDSNGVIFIPAFTGLGAPYWNSEIRASFYGITRDSSKEDLINAAFKSISFQSKDILNCFEKSGIQINALNVDGGMVENKIFIQQLATLLNKNVNVPENKESTAFGVAALAGISKGVMDKDVISKQKRDVVNPINNENNYLETSYAEWKKYLFKILSKPTTG